MELLSPAGSFQHAIAAFKAGSDAIYIGGKSFSARMSAENFSNEEILEIIKYAHQIEKKVYVTMNTLLYQDEFFKAVEFAKVLYESRVDGIIIQDLGLANYLHKTMPNLPLHASTQLNCHSVNQLKVLKELGFTRVVLARESNFHLIKEAKKLGLEVEVFIHGALCVSYSGNCLMSSFIGNRSGNRGRCAQPCRLEYTVMENDNELLKNYSLSTKDLMTLDQIKTLYDLNVDSLKIEGRLKQKEYVYIVTNAYRHALDSFKLNKNNNSLQDDKNNLIKIFSRKFTKGYIFDENPFNVLNQTSSSHQGELIGKVIKTSKKSVFIRLNKQIHRLDGIRFNDKRQYGFQIGRMFVNSNIKDIAYKNEIIEIKNIENAQTFLNVDVIRTSDYMLLNDAEQSLKLDIKIPVSAKLYCYKNKPLDIEIKYKDISFHVRGGLCEQSINKGTSFERIKEQLMKSKDLPFYIKNIDIKGDEDIFIQISSLNELRNSALEKLITLIKEPYECIYSEYSSSIERITNSKGIIAITNNIEQDNMIDDERISVSSSKSNIIQYMNRININPKFVAEKIITHNILSSDKYLIASPYCNITNSYALDAYYEIGYKECMLSLELDIKSIKDIIYDFKNRHHFNPNLGMLIYGKIDMMIIKSCIVGTINNNKALHCNRCHKSKYELKDRMGVKFRLIADENCQTRIINPYPLYIVDRISELKDLGINSYYLIFNDEVNEIPNVINNVIDNLFDEVSIMSSSYTRGHYFKRAE